MAPNESVLRAVSVFNNNECIRVYSSVHTHTYIHMYKVFTVRMRFDSRAQ